MLPRFYGMKTINKANRRDERFAIYSRQLIFTHIKKKNTISLRKKSQKIEGSFMLQASGDKRKHLSKEGHATATTNYKP